MCHWPIAAEHCGCLFDVPLLVWSTGIALVAKNTNKLLRNLTYGRYPMFSLSMSNVFPTTNTGETSSTRSWNSLRSKFHVLCEDYVLQSIVEVIGKISRVDRTDI